MSKKISYTQVSMYNECPWKWKLNYIDDHREFKGNIHTLFGTAMHEVLQKYLNVMYNDSVKNADLLPLDKLLRARMVDEFNKMHEFGVDDKLVSQDEMEEFYQDGLAIIDFFKKRRGEYFSKKGYELIGCEVPVDLELPQGLQWIGYLDIVIKDKIRDVIQIMDIKTSTMGWNKWQKKNKNKTDQLLYYKQFYSMMYNHPIDKIEVEYFIVKRKLYENMDFPQKRVQKFSPASGKPSMNNAMGNLKKFVTEAFTSEGEYNMEHEFEKLPSAKNCKWCEFKDKPELCDRRK